MDLNTSLMIPFISKPIVFKFGFSERQDPFLISVSFLGGGGFFGLAIGPHGVEMLEASLEFGANASIDLVIASGNLHFMAGTYFKYASRPDGKMQCILTGYLRAGGSVEILGIISVSIEFYLGFVYDSGPPKKVWGKPKLPWIFTLFFSPYMPPFIFAVNLQIKFHLHSL